MGLSLTTQPPGGAMLGRGLPLTSLKGDDAIELPEGESSVDPFNDGVLGPLRFLTGDLAFVGDEYRRDGELDSADS